MHLFMPLMFKRKIHPPERVCELCNTGECEDKIYVMFACSLCKAIKKSIQEHVFKNNDQT